MKRNLIIGLAVIVAIYLLFGILSPTNRSSGSKDVQATDVNDFSFSTSGPTLLNIDKLAGSITVNAVPTDTISITVIKTGKGANDAEAQSELKKMVAEVKQEGQNLNFTTRLGGGGWFDRSPSANTVDYTISAPEGTSLKIAEGSGSVTTKYVKGGVDISGGDFDLLLNDIKGNTSIRSEGGSISLTNVAGAVDINSKTASISIQRSSGPSLSVVSSGAINLKDTGADDEMKIKAEAGDLTINRAKAKSLNINAPTGETSITDTTTDEALTFEGGNGGIYVNRGNFNPIQIKTSGGQVTLKEAQGGIDIKTDSGGVDIRQSTANSLKIVAGTGDVLFGGKIPESGENLISTSKGAIQVATPKESPFKLDASTGSGTVTFNIPVTLESEEKSKNQLTGIANSGTALLTLKSESGNIQLSSRQPY